MERITVKDKQYGVVSLFAGIGGLDLGFEFAGFNLIWANDFDKYAAMTYRRNVGDHIVEGDIRLVKDSIPPHDVLIGGFPCQPFSSLGRQKGFEDSKERGTLFFEIMSIVDKHRPKVIVLENVINLLYHDKKRTFARIVSELEDAGYYVNYQLLNTADYGIPQSRNRVFIVAFDQNCFECVPFQYPLKEELKITTQDLMDEEVAVNHFLTKKVSHTILDYTTKLANKYPRIDQQVSKALCASMNKWHRASQDNYLTDDKNFRRLGCPEDRINIRRLTPNECRKLQGFPSDWVQVVSDAQAYKQFGNAVTVDVAYKVACKVLNHMNEYLINK